METSVYDIYFQGEALEGFDQAQLRQNIAKLFQANEQTLNALFSGKTVLLKKDLSKDDALKYQTQLKKAGAKIVIKAKRSDAAAAAVEAKPQTAPAASQSAKPQAIAPQSVTQQAGAQQAAAAVRASTATPAATITAATTATATTTTPASSPWSLSPSGADLLRPEERHEAAPVQVDVSGLSLAAPSPLPQQPKDVPPPPDTSNITIAEVGVQLGTGERERMLAQAKVPDVNFAVAEVGARLEDEHIEIPLPEPDLSQFSLATVGSRLAPEQKSPPPKVPDTSHLTIAPQK